MSQNLRYYTTAVFGLEHVIRLVPDEAWDSPSPCDLWTAREVAGHAMGVVNNVAARAGVGDPIDVFADVGLIAGHDPATRFRQIRDRYLDAMDRAGALQTEVQSSLGQMPMDAFLFNMTADTLIHSWDLARAAGVDSTLDPGLVAVVHASLIERDSPALRAPGRYGEPLTLAESVNAQDELIAFTGRDPHW